MPDDVRTQTALPEMDALETDLGERLALGNVHVVVVAAFALMFAIANSLPLFHTDLWGHVGYGHWILDNGRLPVEDPFLDLAEGVHMVASAWLGQVVLALVERMGGAEGLTHLYALVVTATYLALFFVYVVRTGRLTTALGLTGLVLVVGSTRVLTIRTEIFGTLCFALTLLVAAFLDRRRDRESEGTADVVLRRSPWSAYVLLPLVFAFWANTHGSYVVGLAFFFCQTAGRGLEVLWRTRNPLALAGDHWFRRWLLIGELCTLASFVNPYGIDLLIHNLTFSSNPNLVDVLEWKAMHVHAVEGVWFAGTWILMTFLMRFSRATVRPADVLLLGLLSFSTLFSVRMIGWYAFAFAYAMAPHVEDVVAQCLARLRPNGNESTEPVGGFFGRSVVHTALCGLLIWMSFSLSPISRPILGGEPRSPDRVYNSRTPVRLTAFLRAHPPRGRFYNPQWWGDWIVWDGPENQQPFMTTNAVHLAPHTVWKDYMRISKADTGWQSTLDRYDVQTVIVHESDQRTLAPRMRELDDWEVVYEDEMALVVSRDTEYVQSVRAAESAARAGDATEPKQQAEVTR